MGRRAATISKADIARVVAVAKDAGMAVEILPNGIIRIIPAPPSSTKVQLASKAVESF